MRIETGAAMDIGRVREKNDDGYLVDDPLYVVADGMGGARGGDVASRLALDTVARLAREGKGTLADQLRAANEAVFSRSSKDEAVRGMGTTVTAARVELDEVQLAHVGDSRAYLFRAGDLRLLTEDHTLVHSMVKRGEITRAEAEVHPHRSVLTRVVGTAPDLDVDESTVALLDGDRLLLCTDGLTSMVTEDQIEAILGSEPDPQKAADRLTRAANRAGGVDNITVVVLDAHDDGSAPEPAPRSAGVRRKALRWLVRRGIAALVLAVLLVGVRVYADRQWYVGVRGTHVAIYQGIPATVLGFHFSHVAEERSDLPAASLQALPVWSDLPGGITADSREEAEQIVAQMRADLLAQRKTVAPQPKVSESPSP